MKPLHTLLPFLTLYFLSSSSLLVLNKVAITAIPSASLLLFIQLLSTVIIILVPALSGKLNVDFFPRKKVLAAYVSVANIFLATVYSNFRVIQTVGVNPFIVLRCSTPLLVSILDWMFMARNLPGRLSLASLTGILVGGSLYAHSKLDDDVFINGSFIDSHGGPWCIIWLISFLLDMIYIKYIVDSFPCSAEERTLYQNGLALPFLGLFLSSGIEGYEFRESFRTPWTARLAVTLSCFAGATLSFTGMKLRSELSATSFTVLGILCKMVSMLLNEMFVESEQDLKRLLCIVIVIISSSFYKQAPKRCATR